jgi:hypothetical protein
MTSRLNDFGAEKAAAGAEAVVPPHPPVDQV